MLIADRSEASLICLPGGIWGPLEKNGSSLGGYGFWMPVCIISHLSLTEEIRRFVWINWNVYQGIIQFPVEFRAWFLPCWLVSDHPPTTLGPSSYSLWFSLKTRPSILPFSFVKIIPQLITQSFTRGLMMDSWAVSTSAPCPGEDWGYLPCPRRLAFTHHGPHNLPPSSQNPPTDATTSLGRSLPDTPSLELPTVLLQTHDLGSLGI